MATGRSVADAICIGDDDDDGVKQWPAAAATTKPGAVVVGQSLASKKTTKKQKTKPEKRLRRYRSAPPAKIRERIARSMTQRMFLIQKGAVEIEENSGNDNESSSYSSSSKRCTFSILGSTGNCYDVMIQRLPHCTCPDHAKGNLCKHILFVLLKVMQLPPESPLIYQSAWLSTELEEMFATMEERFLRVWGSSSIIANEKVQQAYHKMQQGDLGEDEQAQAEENSKQKAVGEDDDCPICFDPLLEKGSATKVAFCRAQCGANFHQVCIQTWLRQHRSHPTCPMCRQPWEDGSNIKNDTEGYTNLGTLQGQSKKRDTSTYHSLSGYSKRRRYY